MRYIFQRLKSLIYSNLLLLLFFLFFFIYKIIILHEITTLYYVDVYKYLYKADEIAQTGNFFSYASRGFPFVWLLSIMQMIFSPVINNPISISLITMFIINIFLYLFIFLTIKQLFNRIVAFFSALFILFDPVFIEYSLIAYLEPFSLLMGCLSLYTVVKYFYKDSKILLILSLGFALISGFTRFEMFIIFLLPILIILLLKGFIVVKRKKFFLIFLLGISVFFMFIGPIFLNYYNSITRFDFFTRIIMGISNEEVVKNIYSTLSSMTDSLILNIMFTFFWLTGLILFFYKTIKNIRYERIRKIYSSSLYFLIILLTVVIAISFYGYTYNIINDEIYINPLISTRSLMLLRIIITPLLVYGVYKILVISSKEILKIHKKMPRITFYLKKYRFFRKNHIKLKIFSVGMSFCLLSIFCCSIFPLFWIRGIEKVKFNSAMMKTFEETSEWLEITLEPNEFVFLPVDFIFYINNPNLKEHGLNYDIIWEESGILYIADTTSEDLAIVRQTLIEFIKDNKTDIKYLVSDWMNPIKYIFSLNITDELFELIYLTHEIKAKSEIYQPSIYIYEVI